MDYSVVICTFNRSSLLADAIESVSRQTFRDFELIVVDDGSTDDTPEVVERFRRRVPELHFTRQAHSGPAKARNFGASLASGEVLAFLDSDDLWTRNYLACMHRILFDQKAEWDAAFANGWVVSGSGRRIRPFFDGNVPPAGGALRTSRELFAFFPSVTTSALTVRRAAFERFGGFDARFTRMEDWHWLIRSQRAGLRFAGTEEKLVLYRQHSGNLTRDAALMFEAWLDVYEDALAHAELDAEQARHVRRFARSRIPALLATSKADRAREVLRRAMGELPPGLALRSAWLSTYGGCTTLFHFLRSLTTSHDEGSEFHATVNPRSWLFEMLDRMDEDAKRFTPSSVPIQGEAEKPSEVVGFRNSPIVRGPYASNDRLTTPALSVVIATTGARSSLASCLRSVAAQSNVEAEIIVALNGPRDANFEWEMAGLGVKALVVPERGVSRARNAAVAVARGDLVAFLDDDVEAHPGWAEAIVAGFRDQRVACVTGRVVPDGPTYLAREKLERWYASPQAMTTWTLEPGARDWVWRVIGERAGFGCNMAFRRSFLIERMPLPEDLGAGTLTGCADEDFMFLQVLKQGFTLCHAADAAVTHCFNGKGSERKRREAQLYAGSVAFLLKLLHEEPQIRGQVLQGVARALGRKALRMTARSASGDAWEELLASSEKVACFLRGVRVYRAGRRNRQEKSGELEAWATR